MSDFVVVLVVGCPGSGKSTVCEEISQKTGWFHFRTGEYVRSLSATTTIVEILHILFTRLQETIIELRSKGTNGIIMDRFGRTPEHVIFLQNFLKPLGMQLTCIIHVQVPTAIAVERLQSRTEGPRGDISSRLQYNEQLHSKLKALILSQPETIPWCEIDGTPAVAEVAAATLEAIEENKTKKVTQKSIDCQALSPIRDMLIVDRFDEYIRVITELANRVKNRYLHDFPGTMIAGVLTKDVMNNKDKQIQFLEEYKCGLKIDGERFICMKFQDRLYFIPRSLNSILYLSTTDAQAGWSGGVSKYHEHIDTTILDGEMVTLSQYPNTRLFVVFDVLLWNGRTMFWFPFKKRQHVLPEGLSNEMSVVQHPPPTNVPVLIAYKSYFNIGEIASRPLLRAFPYYPTDGLIFQHHGIYTFRSDKNLLKWKPAEFNTVDFSVVSVLSFDHGHVLQLLTAPREGEEPYSATCKISLADGKLFPSENPVGSIIECSFRHADVDPTEENIIWTFVRIRTDKAVANTSSTVREIIHLNMATEEEVKEWATALWNWPRVCATCNIHTPDRDQGRYYEGAFRCRRCWGRNGISFCGRCEVFTRCPFMKKQPNGRAKFYCEACKSKVGLE